jgi:hypothetical protein
LEQALQYIKAGIWPTAGGPADPYFPYVTMLLHGDGTNGAQNNTFLDSSTNNFSITRNGNTTQGSFSPYGSNWSNYFDGSSYEQLTDTTAIAFGSSDFTVEAFVFPTNVSGTQMIASKWSSASGPWQFFLSTNTANFSITTGSGQFDVQSAAGTIVANTWTHIAVVRQTTSLKIYINGTLSSTTSIGAVSVISRNDTVQIGARTFGGAPNFSGYISNLRTVTSAVYTSAFTPPTTPLTAISGTSLLTCQSNRFVDNSTNAFAITVNGTPSVQRFSPFSPTAAYSTSVIGGSGYFDGSGDLIYCTPSNLTGQFTIEGWYYATAFPSPAVFFGNWDTGCLLRKSGSDLQWYCSPGGTSSSTQTINTNQWYHIAVTRDASNVQRVFLNGVLASSATGAGTVTMTNFCVGAESTGASTSNIWAGYISNFRILNGTCLYTSTFTPPTTPLTAITNTSLLTNFTNGGIFDNAMMNNLETVGNAQISTSVKKFGTGSMAFDGSGDWLQAPNSKNLYIGSGNFTIEFWAYFNSTSGNPYLIMCSNASATAGFNFYLNGANSRWELYVGGPAQTIQAPSAPSTAQWYHVAIVRNGSTVTIYINGSSAVSATNNSWTDETTSPLYIGSYLGSGYYLNGYIDDLRITKGYARYTSNFTPPAAAFPNQ